MAALARVASILPDWDFSVLNACVAEAERVYGIRDVEQVAMTAVQLALEGFTGPDSKIRLTLNGERSTVLAARFDAIPDANARVSAAGADGAKERIPEQDKITDGSRAKTKERVDLIHIQSDVMDSLGDGGAGPSMAIVSENTKKGQDPLSDTANNNEPVKVPTEDEAKLHASQVFAFLVGIFKDADPDWLKVKISKHGIADDKQVQDLVDSIFSLSGKYPKRLSTSVGGGGVSSSSAAVPAKRRWDDDGNLIDEEKERKERAEAEAKVVENAEAARVLTLKHDFTQIDGDYVRDRDYYRWCPIILANNFRKIPLPFIRSIFSQYGSQLIPAYLRLLDLSKHPDTAPYREKKTNSSVVGIPQTTSGILELELAALQEIVVKNGTIASAPNEDPAPPSSNRSCSSAATNAEEEEDAGDYGIECGCCYCEYQLTKMTQCNDGHLFCLECARRAAENLIGLRKTDLHCLDTSGCKFLFPRSEMERFLNPQVLAGYDRLCQEESLRVAEIAGLTSCPFCDYAVIIVTDPKVDKLFNCENVECMVISCRLCKRKNHIPQTCEEVSKDDALSVRHKIEEAMTEALLRKCPKCANQYFKEDGCNKMQCPRCHTLQCYVCKEVIIGYDHFATNPSGQVQNGKACPLWEDTAKRNSDEIERAAQAALAEAKTLNPAVNEAELKLDVSAAAPPAPDAQRQRDIEQARIHAERIAREAAAAQDVEALGRAARAAQRERQVAKTAAAQNAMFGRHIASHLQQVVEVQQLAVQAQQAGVQARLLAEQAQRERDMGFMRGQQLRDAAVLRQQQHQQQQLAAAHRRNALAATQMQLMRQLATLKPQDVATRNQLQRQLNAVVGELNTLPGIGVAGFAGENPAKRRRR
ncbi:hypothetical protein BC830DRAFT_1167712 [Chytriomyces sp. MP71]|nr:hypothetical protein BC830DRAFT_1172849 [Chytriomyces sp. MP71]KAI8616582.1 hypothetical protein BC830DRAFT_1167712 [Chytriomyces sp. MP71]